jgi:antitoxin FitA
MDLTLSPTDGTAANRQIYPAILNLTPGLPADPGRGPAGRQASRPHSRAFNALTPEPSFDRVWQERLRLQAARHGRSMEAEMRVILTEAVREAGDEEGLVPALMDRFAELGGVELEIPARTARPRAAELG